MRKLLYVRNLAKVQKQIGMLSGDLAALTGTSLSTLRRIKKGMPISIQIANRIRRRISRQKWIDLIVFEPPNYVLKLALDPKSVRLTGLHRYFKVSLISAPILVQAINGRTFTKTFAKKLRTFLRWIPLETREFIIEPIEHSNSRKHRPLEEWRAKIDSLASGDALIDLVVTLRDQFRCFFQHEDIIERKLKAIKKSGSAQINELRIPTTSIQALTVAEQNLLVAFGLAHNELAFLARLGTVGGYQTRSGRIFDAFSLSQQLTILKLYAGKIHECWNLVHLRYFRTQLSKKFDTKIKQYAKDNLKFLKKYFNKPKNVISLVRNEAAFHYSRANVHQALNRIKGEHGCVTYLSGGNYHYELYDFCEMAMATHLLDQIDADRKRAVVTFQQELAEVGTKLSHFLKDILFIILQDAVAIQPKRAKIVVSDLGLDRKKNSTPIPVFIRPGQVEKTP